MKHYQCQNCSILYRQYEGNVSHTTRMVNAIQKAVSTVKKVVYSGLYRSEGGLYCIIQKPVDIVQSSDDNCIYWFC